MEWIFDIFKENYLKIVNSGKEVEGRVPDMTKPSKHYHLIKPKDILTIRVVGTDFKPTEDKSTPSLSYEVTYIKKYLSVEEMIKFEDLKRVLPEVNSLEEAVSLYHNLPGYSERIKQNGIYAIGLKSI